MQTPEGMLIDTCLPCKSAWVHGDPTHPAPRADSSIPIPFNCPVCVDPILTELRYRTEKDELKVEYCRNCHGAWVEQARLGAWSAVLTPAAAVRLAPATSPATRAAAPAPGAKGAADSYDIESDLNAWRRFVTPAIFIVILFLSLLVVRALLREDEAPAPGSLPPPAASRSRAQDRGETDREPEREAGGAPRQDEVEPLAPGERRWTFTPTPALEGAAPFEEEDKAEESGEDEGEEDEEVVDDAGAEEEEFHHE